MGNSHIKLSNWIFEERPLDGLTLPPAVKAYWKLDEAEGNAIDTLGFYTMAEHGTVPSDSDGLFSNCRGGFSSTTFFATTGAVSGGVVTDPNFDVSSGSTWFIDCFIKPYKPDNTFTQMPVCAINRDTGLRYDYDGSNGYTVQGLNTASSQVDNSSISPLPSYLGEWTHIMIAKVGEGGAGQLILWINGVEIDSADSSSYAYAHGEFTVGKRNSSTSYAATTIKICDLAWGNGLNSETLPGAGSIKERLAAIAVARYNDGAGQQYIIP